MTVALNCADVMLYAASNFLLERSSRNLLATFDGRVMEERDKAIDMAIKAMAPVDMKNTVLARLFISSYSRRNVIPAIRHPHTLSSP